jgi:hypothetical protein
MRVFAVIIVFAASLPFSAAAVQLSDEQLRQQIVGVWYTEDMKEVTRHVGSRLQYFPDGRFIGDYRISTPGGEQYLRTIGRWNVDHGLFTETVDKISDPKESIPPLVRRVIAIDSRHMIIAPVSNSKGRCELWRGKTKLDGSEPRKSVITKKLLADLESMHVSGFRPVDAGNGMVSWRVDSRAVQAAADRAKNK